MPVAYPVRLPWPINFPDVIIHTALRTRDAHSSYAAAKTGDPDSALTLAIDLLDVAATASLTESRDARRISLRPETLSMLRERHGEELDHLWRTQFGYGIDCLTEVEAQNLCRQQSVTAIEDFLAKAAIEASGRGLKPAVEPDL